MTLDDLRTLADELALATRDHIARAIGDVASRMAALETRIAGVKDGAPGPQGPGGDRGEKGLPGERGDIGPAGPQGDRGAAGAVGEKGLTGDVGPVGPVGPAGAAGRDGVDGKDGASGRDGDTGAPGPQGDRGDVGPQGPIGPIGETGDRGEKGDVGERGPAGPAGQDGAAATGIADAIVDQDGVLVLTFTDGSTKAVGKVIGKAGRDGMPGVPGRAGDDGKDGQDGLGFDDLQIEHDGERRFTVTFVRGERVKRVGEFVIPALIYRGVWDDERDYAQGDAVTWGGHVWISKGDTRTKPEATASGAKHWQLAVKAGRDGKEGKSGPVGPAGPHGPKGDLGPARW